MKGRLSLLIIAALVVSCGLAQAFTVPADNSKAKLLYVFGPEGNTYYGADDVDHEQVVYVDVPKGTAEQVTISVYDPDTGNFVDLKPDSAKEWATATEFAVYGAGNKVLGKQEFDISPEYDRAYYTFGPYSKEQGEPVGDIYRFKVVAKAIKGEDQNLFSLKITPEDAEAFSYKVSFRLLPKEGDKMYFYPGIPAGTSKITAQNYDLDPDGGTAMIVDASGGGRFKLNNSESASWAETALDLGAASEARRLDYIITKKTQKHANAAVRVKDANGKDLPIYFRKGKPVAMPKPAPAPVAQVPDMKCNKFTFDATSSYDPDNEKLSYLWEFGDGTTATDPVVTHIYEKGGQYTVRLTVKDPSALECDTATTTQFVTVNTPPIAVCKCIESACVGDEVTFDASGSTDNTQEKLTYKWNFGDGATGEGVTAKHVYAKGGVYRATLTVDDNENSACSVDVTSCDVKVNAAPVAVAGEDINRCLSYSEEYKVTFDGSKSSDADGDTLNYTWNFGDGESATGKTVSHTYKKGGVYNVRLIVDDGKGSRCSSGSDSLTVKLNKQPVALAGNDIVACAGDEITLDGSGSQDADGDAVGYKWEFGDGAKADGAKVTHVYQKGGTYKAILTVDDGKGTQCSQAMDVVNIMLNTAPVAKVTDSGDICVGQKVSFDASGSSDADGDTLSYTWDFGDGTSAKGTARETHTYTKGGNYSVLVTVDDKKGTACSTSAAKSVVKVNTPPVADAGPNTVCCLGADSQFDGSKSYDPDGNKLSYMWDFGDGSTAEGAKVSHVYKARGAYTVTLTVDDNSGTPCSKATSGFRAVVNEKPVPVIKIR